MEQSNDTKQLKALRDYAAGLVGTRETITGTELHDYADLVIALAQNDPSLPKLADAPEHRAASTARRSFSRSCAMAADYQNRRHGSRIHRL